MLYLIILYLFNLQLFDNSIKNCDLNELKEIIKSPKISFSEINITNLIKEYINNKCITVLDYLFNNIVKSDNKYTKNVGYQGYNILSELFDAKLKDSENEDKYNGYIYKYFDINKNNNGVICGMLKDVIYENNKNNNIFFDVYKKLNDIYGSNIKIKVSKYIEIDCHEELIKQSVYKNNTVILNLLLKNNNKLSSKLISWIVNNDSLNINVLKTLETNNIIMNNFIDENGKTILDYILKYKDYDNIKPIIDYLKSKGIKKACKVLNKSCIDLSNRLIFVSRFMSLSDGATEIYENF